MSSKAVGLEVEGQRRVGLIQEQVDPWQVDPVPLEHGAENLAGDTQNETSRRQKSCGAAGAAAPPPDPLPQGFLFHRGDDLRVDVHVEVELEAETFLAGVLQGRKSTAVEFTRVGSAASSS